MPHFLVPRLQGDAELELPPSEARHASRSLRLKAGDAITLIDGAGGSCDGRILRLDAGRVFVRAGALRKPDASRVVVIAAAVPKGKRLEWMIQKLTELGVSQFVPVRFERSVARWPSGSKSARLMKVVEEAAKQSGRASLMTLEAEATLADAVSREGATFVAVPGADRALAKAAAPGFSRVLIGPEGGFAPGEIESISAVPVSLGRGILRIETAAVAAAAVLAQV